MVAVVGDGNKKDCKYELEQAAKGGWHQGQLFYYRLPVERPGLYTVRLTVVFFHDDERRGDGITLGVDELMEVRLQCVASRGHVVVPVKRIGKDLSESMGVVEFHTVALGGEILVEAEGIYTCIGLSLIETFYHDEQQLQAPVVPGRYNKDEARIPHTMAAAESAPLLAAWDDGAGALCAEKYSSEATRRGSLQAVSPSSTTAQDQKYFDEWARRERLEDSAGRYCRPHSPPRWGEPGWTWADHSPRVLRERAEATRKEEENKARRQEAADGHAKIFYEAAVEAAKKNGVSPGTAKILAAEAVEKALEDTDGQPLTLVQGKEAAMAAGRVAISLLKARGGRKQQQSNEPPVAEPLPVTQPAQPHAGAVDTVELTQRRQLLSVAAASTPIAADGKPAGGDSAIRQASTAAGQDQRRGDLVNKTGSSNAAGSLSGGGGDAAGNLSGGGDADGGISGGGSAPRRRALLGPANDIDRIGATTKGGSVAYTRKPPSKKSEPGGGRAAAVDDGKGQADSEKGKAAAGGDGATGEEKGKGTVEDGDDAKRGGRINPEDPIPPPRCPPRLVELLEEALRVEAERPAAPSRRIPPTGAGGSAPAAREGTPVAVASTPVAVASTAAATASASGYAAVGGSKAGNRQQRRRRLRRLQQSTAPSEEEEKPDHDSNWSPAVAVALLQDGAAAAEDRARSRAERGDGKGNGLGRELWEPSLGGGVLPSWLSGIAADWGREIAAKQQAAAAPAPSAAAAVAVLPRSVVAQQALGSGFQAIAAYRAHEVTGWKGGGVSGSVQDKAEGGSAGSRVGSTTEPPVGGDEQQLLPVRFTGFTWDGSTVVAKETAPGCARTAKPPPTKLSTPRQKLLEPSEWGEDDDQSLPPSSDGGGGGDAGSLDGGGAAAQARRGMAESGGGGGMEGRLRQQPCLKVEAAFVPTRDIVVDIVVPVSAGLVPRLKTLLPQMEKLAKGSGCTPHHPSAPLAPQCNDADHYAPAFWPETLAIRGQSPSEWSFELDYSEILEGSPAGGGLRGGTAESDGPKGKGHAAAAAAAAAAVKESSSFRVVVATEDPAVEAMLENYDVETVFVLSSSPFSKALAIQDASTVIPDDHIMFVHDADLFPPCTLPDALRQTVVQGVQAVNLLLAYENQPVPGKCIYPLSTFGPMAMYASDYRAVGGIADANSGRWGYEDTAFLHKVMLGEKPLGVLRVHLPGLVHRWHEITPWKCMVWVWGGAPSGSSSSDDGTVFKNTSEPPQRSTADALGA
ncbi:unnamed protein product [Ectocarpus sp. 4 AP-2014]